MKKKSNLKKEFKSALNYIKESKNYIYIITSIFFFACLLGYFFPVPESVLEMIKELIKELIDKTEGMSLYELTIYIFLNNTQSVLLGLILGVFLGIFPIFVSLANGYLAGYVSSLSVKIGGILSLWRLLPHGIFELPAIFISLGLGLKLGTFIFKEKKYETLKTYFWNSMKVFVFIIIPLLVIAAIIESILITLLS